MANCIETKLQKIKLIVSDIDHMFLDSRKNIVPEHQLLFQTAKKQGFQLSICTEQIAPIAEYYAMRLGIESPLITANGAVIWDPVKRQPLVEVPIEPRDVQAILELCHFYQMDYGAFTNETCYFSKNSVRINCYMDYNRYAAKNGLSKIKLGYFDEKHECVDSTRVYRMSIFDTQCYRLNKMEEFMRELNGITYSFSEPNRIEVSAACVNKGSGIKKLSEILEYTPDEVLVMDNYENDIVKLYQIHFESHL